MKLPDDEDPAKLQESLLACESPFSWDMPEADLPIDVFISNLTDKCKVVEEEHMFQWTRFIPHLILSYLLCEKKKEYTRAIEYIQWCVDHCDSVRLNKYQEPLFDSVREVIAHILVATKANILLAAGNVELARKEADVLFNNGNVGIRYLRSTKNRAGLLGLKAAVYLQLRGKDGTRRALEAAKEARNLDPDQAEWWYIVGNALSHTRRDSWKDEVISTDEVEAIEKAFALQKDASYTVYLAQLYVDLARESFFNQQYEKSTTYNHKAAARFREALQIRPNCLNLKARVAHGMLRIRTKDPLDAPFIKNLLDEVVKSCPNRVMAYTDLGLYYSQIEKDTEKAIYNVQKAFEMGSWRAITLLAQLKWKNGLESQLIDDFKKGLRGCKTQDDTAMLYSYLGASHALIHDDWESAIPCFQMSLNLDPSAKFMERFRGFNGKFVNLLELVINQLQSGATDANQTTINSFLAEVTLKKPQMVRLGKNQFLNWKKELEKLRGCPIIVSELSQDLVNSVKGKLTDNRDDCIDERTDSLSMLSTQMAELIRSINNMATNVATKDDVKSIGSDVELIRKEVNTIDEKVEVLEPRMNDAETRLEKLESIVKNLEQEISDRMNLEGIMMEFNDRNGRANNVILNNLLERMDGPAETKITHDKRQVLKVCQAINYKIDLTGIRFIRLGKPATGKYRPLLVVFKTPNEAKSFIEKYDSLKCSEPTLMGIGVTRDKTDRERQYLKYLREELENRARTGEMNLTIKYKNGVPAIVSKYSTK